jgi:hypothetical protein
MWSLLILAEILSIITYTLLCGYSPFRSEERDELIEETIRAKIIFHERYWKDISEDGMSRNGHLLTGQQKILSALFFKPTLSTDLRPRYI